MGLRLAALFSLGVVAFAACGNDSESSGPEATPDGGTGEDARASSSSSSGSSGKPNVDSGSGPFKEEENLPCEGRTVNDAVSVYVAVTGADGPTCGTREAPCKTVMAGFAKAYAEQKPKVLIGAGTYTEALLLDGGFTFEGGWDVSGSTWTANCSAGHSSLATIQTPDDANVSVKATKGATVLRFLTIKSKPTAAPGESLYGIIAIGPDVKVALDDSILVVAAGGKGADGAPGAGTLDSTCGASSDGAAGAAGKDGTATSAGTLSSTAFTPGVGGDGAPGENGHQGTAPPVPSSIDYDSCVVSGDTCTTAPHTIAPVLGQSGCGGGGGRGGKGGGGGGSSIGILASNSLIVTYGGSVTTGAGGVGGNGGSGVVGANGTLGKDGTVSTYFKVPNGGCVAPACSNTSTDLPGGTAGGNGGKGGDGGQGSGGPGGWSISFAKFSGAALLASTTTVFTTTVGGKGGMPNGTDGLRQQQWP